MNEKVLEEESRTLNANEKERLSLEKKASGLESQFKVSEQLLEFLKVHNVSLGFTTYHTGKTVLVGRLQKDDQVSIYQQVFNQSLGLASSGDGQQLALGTAYQIWRFANAVPLNEGAEHDKVYIPQAGYTTGVCHSSDLGFDKEGKIVFVNTLFSCVATISETESFMPLWKPPFISSLAPEDRCHLSGLGFRDGEPRYVSGFSQTDTKGGWSEHRHTGGFIMDIKTNEVLCAGLTMPHSPRWYQDKLWVLNSGGGEFGYVDMDTKQFKAVTLCPGYARGLSFCGNFALIGLSKLRSDAANEGLIVEKRLAAEKAESYCALQVVDLRTGETAPLLLLEKPVEEIRDVIVLPNTRNPMLVGFRSDEIYRYMVFNQELLK
ncbi:MAG: hypothetical protein K0R48_333 [Gammaproteobacteria bacterium]|jgi:uncharacterized protein (TIGR03032 family)|nr:hypothetical protein [Gammaproteobacteria bacterium]